MNNEDNERLRRLFVRVSLLLFVTIIILALWGSYQFRNFKQIIAYQNTKLAGQMVVHDGKDGSNGISIAGPSGPTGAQGNPGNNGQNGANITPDQIAQAVSDYFKQNPVLTVKGDQGLQGISGKTMVLCNLVDGTLGFSYVGDIGCQSPENQ